MSKFMQGEVEVEAYQWTGDDTFVGFVGPTGWYFEVEGDVLTLTWDKDPNQQLVLHAGDWLVYPPGKPLAVVPNDQFTQEYQPVPTEESTP